MKKKYHLYGIGNALVDMEFKVDDAFLEQMGIGKGVMTLVDEARQHEIIQALHAHPVKRSCGGSAANTIIGAQQFGGQCFYSCKVANDETGHFYRDDLLQAGVHTNLGNQQEPGVTGKCLVLITPDAERTMNTFLGITETVSFNEVSESALIASDYLYLEGYLSTSETGRAAAVKAKETAARHQVKIALTFSDPNMVRFFKPQLSEMIGSGVDLIFCNEQEALMWADTPHLNNAMEALKTLACQFVITRGAKGAVAFDGQELVEIDAYPVSAVDTNGAGDLFAGAFLYGVTHGFSFAKAGALASKSSATLVTEFGPRLALEKQREILDALNMTQYSHAKTL